MRWNQNDSSFAIEHLQQMEHDDARNNDVPNDQARNNIVRNDDARNNDIKNANEKLDEKIWGDEEEDRQCTKKGS